MILLRVVALCFVTCTMLASTQVNAQDKADQLRAIERSRLRSLVDADLATARRLHADDFELIDPRGGTHSKEQYLRDIASGDLNYLEWEPVEIRVSSTAIQPSSGIKRTYESQSGEVKAAPSRSGIRTSTKSERDGGKSSGRMPPKSHSDEKSLASARLTTGLQTEAQLDLFLSTAVRARL